MALITDAIAYLRSLLIDAAEQDRNAGIKATLDMLFEVEADFAEVNALTRTAAIRRVCRLAEEVANLQTGHNHPNDCICGQGGLWDSPGYVADGGFRNSGEALDYIERAVRDQLNRDASASL